METTSTRKAVIHTEHPQWVEVSFSRHDAIALQKVLAVDTSLSDSTRKRLKKMLVDKLKPYYTYQIKCRDCPRVYPFVSQKVIPTDEIAKGGICVVCSDDYK